MNDLVAEVKENKLDNILPEKSITLTQKLSGLYN